MYQQWYSLREYIMESWNTYVNGVWERSMLSPMITGCPLDMFMVVACRCVAPWTRCERLIHTTAAPYAAYEDTVNKPFTPRSAATNQHTKPTT